MSKHYITVVKHIEIVWEIDGHPDYVFGKDKKLYNRKTGRHIKMTLNGATKGFWLSGEFYTLNKLKPLLKRPELINLPF